MKNSKSEFTIIQYDLFEPKLKFALNTLIIRLETIVLQHTTLSPTTLSPTTLSLTTLSPTKYYKC